MRAQFRVQMEIVRAQNYGSGAQIERSISAAEAL
jgi:hypothetical protein